MTFSHQVKAQDRHGIDFFTVNSIIISGNKKTKKEVILRELNFSKGDTLFSEGLDEVFKKNEDRIYNTGLFLIVEIQLRETYGYSRNVVVIVKERFFSSFIPILELADRNFNEWWVQRGRDFKRLNIGIDFKQKNLLGRNQWIRAKLQAGFTKKAELFYYIPHIDRHQRIGLHLKNSFIANKAVAYRTLDHKLAYTEDGKIIRTRWESFVSGTYRNRFNEIHILQAGYNNTWVGSNVTELNPGYFGHDENRQQFFSLKYSFLFDKRDRATYPFYGSFFKASIKKYGMGVFNDLNLTELRLRFGCFMPLGGKFYFASGTSNKISFPLKQPYYNIRALGYENDYVRGYELYVVDGTAFSLWRNSLKYNIFNFTESVKQLPFKKFQTIPVSLYLTLFVDGGYAFNNQPAGNTRLSNRFLWGGGAGLDIVTYYDIVIRLEYSVNRFLEQGIYLNFKAAINTDLFD